MKGIDLSEFNGNIDFKKVKKDGIEFVILRCGYGKNESQKDSNFEEYYKQAKKEGLKIGCYLYSYCSEVANAKLEAKNCLKFIKGKQMDLPVFYDLEDASVKKLGKTNITKIAVNFCKEIQNAGYTPGVYANLDWFTNYINVKKVLDYKIWLAQWNDRPTADFRVDYWQYTSSGKVNGIKGRVDLDKSYVEEKPKITKKTNEEIAKEVINGEWGNGMKRKEKLTKASYNYDEIQDLVNKILAKKPKLKKGDYVRFTGTRDYFGVKLDDWTYNNKFNVLEVIGDKVIIGRGKIITAVVNIKYCKKI